MKTLVSWSSGKDSAWMLHVLNQDPSVEIGGLLTTMNEQFDRVAMHAVRRQLLEAQAEAAGVPLRTVPLPWPCTNEEYEARMRKAVEQAVAEGFTHVAFGDLSWKTCASTARTSSPAPASRRSSPSGPFRPMRSHLRWSRADCALCSPASTRNISIGRLPDGSSIGRS